MINHSIPKIFYHVTEDVDVMDAFLTHFSLEISHQLQDIIKDVNIIDTLSGKERDKEFLANIMPTLEDFLFLGASTMSFITTFSSLAYSNPLKAVDTVDLFFPAIIGNGRIKIRERQSILSFFPEFEDDNSYLSFIIGLVSESVFSLLVTKLFEKDRKSVV